MMNINGAWKAAIDVLLYQWRLTGMLDDDIIVILKYLGITVISILIIKGVLYG